MLPGVRYGPYVVLSELGRGGMGVVYHARHEQSGQEVALKVLLEVRGPEDLQRFEREGQAVARLRHPGIVQVHVTGTEAGRPWMAMELVRGVSLRERLRREGPLEPGAARRLFAKLAGALEHAHRHGVLHRDLKPENVILDPSGEPRLIDFGLAQVTDRSRLTRTGELAGTAAYMAPEQAVGDRELFGPWTDVYGLGATLYDALTGHPPFAGSGLFVLDHVVRRPPRHPTELRPGLDPGLVQVCLACLEKDPGQRPPTAAAFGQLLSGRGAARRRTKAPLAAAALLLAITAALVVALLLRPHRPLPLGPTVAPAPPPPPPATAPAPVPAHDRHALRVQRGLERFAANDLVGALADLEAALDLAPSVVGYVTRSRLRVGAGLLDAAGADTLSALALDPTSAEAHVARGAYLHRTGDLRGAMAEAAEALRHAPHDLEALRLSIAVRLAAGDFRNAGLLLDEGLARHPGDAELLSNRASLRGMNHDDEGLLADLTEVERLKGGLTGQELIVLAKALFRLKRWGAADRAYERARAMAPQDDPVLTDELALEGRQVGARARAEEGLAAYARGDLGRAIALLTRAIELDPSFTNAWYNRGLMHLDAGDARAALADFDVSITREDDVLTRLSRATALTRLGESDRALADLDVAVERGSVEALLERALLRRARGDLAGARADLELGVSRTEPGSTIGQALRREQAAHGP